MYNNKMRLKWRQYYIYGLSDPREPDVIRYIGKVDNVNKRLSQHISAAKESRYPLWGSYYILCKSFIWDDAYRGGPSWDRFRSYAGL